MAGRYEYLQEAPRYEFVDEPTHGESPRSSAILGGLPAIALAYGQALSDPNSNGGANFLIGGPLRGASNIGNTLLEYGAKAAPYLRNLGAPMAAADLVRQLVTDRLPPAAERRAGQKEFFEQQFSPESAPFKTGELATEIAGTSAIGPVLAAPLRAAAGAGRVLPALANAIESGGMRTGAAGLPRAADLTIRSAGGAINGYGSVGMIDPQSANGGALVGSALPPALQGFKVAGTAAAQGMRALRPPPGVSGADVRAVRDIASMAGVNVNNADELARLQNLLRQEGPQMIPGAQTVPEILQAPGVSQLQRSVKAVQPAPFVARDAEREAARRSVLERIGPIGNPRDVAQEVGTNIAERAIPAEREAARRVSELFDAVPSDQAVMQLPMDAMSQARARYLGPGTFGKGNTLVDNAIDEAGRIGTRRVPSGSPMEFSSSDVAARGRSGSPGLSAQSVPQPVPFDQLQKLRSSISEAITNAERNGNNQARAALIAMKNAIDNKVAEVASGTKLPGEVFTPQAVDAWGQALSAHAAKKLQFNTGPQAALFRRGGDGLPLVQGGEIPRRFFNGNASQLADAQSFRRLVQDDPRMMADLRRFAISNAASQTDRFGNLTNAKFNHWLDARTQATGEIFSQQQRAWLKAIAEDLRRADVAESLGRSTGSDTAQKAASMMQLGLVDNPVARYMAGRIPFGNAAMDFLSGPARAAKAERLGGLLTDPEKTAGLLSVLMQTKKPPITGLLGAPADPLLYQSAPLLLTAPGR